MKPILVLPFVFTTLALSVARAEVRLHPLFSDNAVLQQGVELPVWGTAKDGEKVTVTFDGQSASTTAKDGRWQVRLKAHKAGGPLSLNVEGGNKIAVKDVLVGDVWICSGQSNMAFGFPGASTAAAEAPNAKYPNLRTFTVARKTAVEPQTEPVGSWLACSPETVKNFSAVAYFFGRDIHKATGTPVGLIHTSWGGTPAQAWTSLSGLKQDKELADYVSSIEKAKAGYAEDLAKAPEATAKYEAAMKQWEAEGGKAYEAQLKKWLVESEKAKAEGKAAVPPPQRPKIAKPIAPRPPGGGPGTPTVLYNAMIAPLLPYPIKGAIWYQGESNAKNAREYRTLFPRMIADWREKWGLGNFPFFFVQIAPHKNMLPEIREAQLLTLSKSPNTGMAVTVDVGNAADIHPRDKEPVGSRLALAARAMAYGEKIEYSGPVFDGLKVENGKAVLSFKHIGSGLMAKGGEWKGFTVASAANGQFVPAKAEIRKDKVVVSCPQVPNPAAVRYGWENVPDVNLFNKEGIPASPFRTDVD